MPKFWLKVVTELKNRGVKDKKAVVADLETVYTATNAEAARENLKAFRIKVERKIPNDCRFLGT